MPSAFPTSSPGRPRDPAALFREEGRGSASLASGSKFRCSAMHRETECRGKENYAHKLPLSEPIGTRSTGLAARVPLSFWLARGLSCFVLGCAQQWTTVPQEHIARDRPGCNKTHKPTINNQRKKKPKSDWFELFLPSTPLVTRKEQWT